MSCFLKDHCNRLLSHCSVKGCDFFPNTTNPEKGKEKENHFGRERSNLDLGFLIRSYRPFDQFYKTRIHFYSNDGTFRIEDD